MSQPKLSDLVEEIDLILTPEKPRSSQFPPPKSFIVSLMVFMDVLRDNFNLNLSSVPTDQC